MVDCHDFLGPVGARVFVAQFHGNGTEAVVMGKVLGAPEVEGWPVVDGV